MTHTKRTGKVPRLVRRLLWVAAGLSLLYFARLMLDLVTHPFSPGNNLLAIPYLFRWLFAAAGTFTVVVAIAIALLRHRLWDIDLIIGRTLVYFGGETLFQWLFTNVTGQQSPAGVVISTLVLAALFTTLRRRVQDFIDRCFYRTKYDAQQAMEEFSAAARREVGLANLTSNLVCVVN